MAQFRFRVEDKHGRVRTGRITASNKIDAESRIEQAGMKLLELTQTTETSAISIRDFQKKSGWKPPRAEPYELDDSFLDRFLSRIPKNLSYNAVFGAMATVGLLWVAATWAWGAKKKVVVEIPKNPINITILGNVAISGLQDFGDVQMMMDFPEVPYQISRKWNELEHPAPGQFKWQTEFMTRTSPRDCIVRAIKPYHAEASSPPLNLRTNQSSYQVNLKLTPEAANAASPTSLRNKRPIR